MTKVDPQLDREIAEVVDGRPASVGKRPLYGHASEATAYVVADYPYGYRERTTIRYWLEQKPKKGWRLVSQTKNPKTGAWNKPKPSTYADWGAAMYLDRDGHVQWEGVGPYSDERKILAFAQAFPGARSELSRVAPAKLRFLRGQLDGRIVFEVNGVPQPLSESDVERIRGELATWEEIGALVGRAP
jgi:hypothetical protein